MKKRKNIHIAITLILTLIFLQQISGAEEVANTQFGLPEHAKARFGEGEIYDMQYSANGAQLALATSLGIWVYDAKTLQVQHLLEKHEIHVRSIAFHPDRNILASCDLYGNIYLWDMQTGTHQRELTRERSAFKIVYDANGDTIAACCSNGDVHLYDAETGETKKVLQKVADERSFLYDAAFSPNENIIATAVAGEQQNSISLWDTISGELKKELNTFKMLVMRVAFSPDGTILASAGADGSIILWDTQTFEQTHILKVSMTSVNDISFSPDGSLLTAGCSNGTVHLWDVNTGEHKHTFDAHKADVISVASSPDFRSIASVGRDRSLRTWNLLTHQNERTRSKHFVEFHYFDVSTDGKTIASSTADRNAYFWDVASGTVQDIFKLKGLNYISGLALSPDGETFAITVSRKDIYLIAMHTHEQTTKIQKEDIGPRSFGDLAVSPDGKTLASDTTNNTVTLWDADTGERKHTLSGHTKEIISICFSHDGRMLTSAGFDGTIRIWDANTGEEKRIIRGDWHSVLKVVFSPDNKLIACAAFTGDIQFFDVETGQQQVFLGNHQNQITCVTFSPDGRFLAFGDNHGQNVIMDLGAKRTIRTYEGPHRVVADIRYALDGKVLLSLIGGAIYVWDVADL